jgi:hypothetical protein
MGDIMKARSNRLFAMILIVAFLILHVFDNVYADVEDLITQSFKVGSGGLLTLVTERGSIEVKTLKAERVKVEVTREVAVDNDKKANKILNKFAIEFQHSEKDVTIRAEFKTRKFFFWDDGRSRLKVHYLISVPEKYNLALKTSGGSISVDNLEGEVHSKTSGGSLYFGNIEGPVQGKTSGGSISLNRCIGTADIRTSGGNIKIGEVDGSVKAETSGGSIQIQSAKGSVSLPIFHVNPKAIVT